MTEYQKAQHDDHQEKRNALIAGIIIGVCLAAIGFAFLHAATAEATPESVMPEDKTCVVEIKYSQIKATHVMRGVKR